MKLRFNSKLLFILVSIFAVVSITDVITAMFILDNEANPLYLITGSSLLMWIGKIVLILMVFFVYFKNKYKAHLMYFLFIQTILLGILLFGIGVFSNINGMINEDVMTYNDNLSQEQKMVGYWQIVTVLFLLPYLFGMGSFLIYQKTYKKIGFD